MPNTLEIKEKTQSPRQQLTLVVSELINGYTAYMPNPEDTGPQPWPWRSVVAKALERMSISSQTTSYTRVALNPQPLPPKILFSISLAQEVIERAILMQEIMDGLTGSDNRQGSITVSGYINMFVDDICPQLPKIKIPEGYHPKPVPDPDPSWTGLELAVIAAYFQSEAKGIEHEGIKDTLHKAGEKLMEAALSRMG